MKFTSRLTLADYVAFRTYQLTHATRYLLITAIFAGLAVLLALFVVRGSSEPGATGGDRFIQFLGLSFLYFSRSLAVALVALGFTTVLIWLMNRNKAMFMENTLEFNDVGIRCESPQRTFEFNWSAVQKLVRTSRYIYIYVSWDGAIFLPRRVVNGSLQWEQTYQYLAARVSPGAR